jgi:hypothetical protein
MIDKYLVAGSLGIIGSILLAVIGYYFTGVSPNLVASCIILFILGIVGIVFHESFQNPMYVAKNIKTNVR